MRDATCVWPECGRDPCLSWLGRWLCETHWRATCGTLAKARTGFGEAYDAIRVPKKWRLCETPPGPGDLPDPDLFDYSV